jgi:hypothetical protein
MELLAGLGPLGLPELAILVFLVGIVGLPLAIIFAVTNKGTKSNVQPSPSDAATRLRELARLHEEGILTDEEYEAKRSAIAQRM